MKFTFLRVVGIACLAFSLRASAESVDFSRDIQPILVGRCFKCHGPESASRKADLRLDQEAGAKASVIVPGKSRESELLRRVMGADPEDRMPPAESGKAPLSPEEVELVRRWIDEGAPWAAHWAFEPPVLPQPPAVHDTRPGANEIDPFVLTRLKAAGLDPAPLASPETLIRRVTLDLTGLPPTLKEIDAFLRDESAGAYEKVVDRLLASPHYGERMATDWLDGARYADTNGYQNDFKRTMWPWRDWVINAFNDNMPFDQFTIEQIAGDLLPDATDSQRIATGFNRNNHSVTEGGSIEEEWLVENLIDRVETTSFVFLGLSMGCARCHEHKYDPISQREFYEFYAFFNSTEDRGYYNEVRGNTGPTLNLPSAEDEVRLAELDASIAAATKILEKAEAELDLDFDKWEGALMAATPPEVPSPPRFQFPLMEHLAVRGEASQPFITLASAYHSGTAALEWDDGLVGPALVLDGAPDAYVDLGQSIRFERNKPFSLSIWVRPDGAGALFSKVDDFNEHRGVEVEIKGGGTLLVQFMHHRTANLIRIATDRRLKTGTWSHVCVTYDGSSKAAGIKVYVNGEEASAQVEKDTLTKDIDNDVPLRLGQRSSGKYLEGALADLRYFDEVLSPNEVADLGVLTLKASATGERAATRRSALEAYFKLIQSYEVLDERKAVAKLNGEKENYISASVLSVMVMRERAEPRPTYLLKRGAYDAPDKSEVLKPGIPDFLPQLPEGTPANRLGLARWLVSSENPLTARVTVNRIWMKFFGQGIVKSVENFGTQGAPPSHPLLLDWLAITLMEDGWDLKAIQKRIVMSATYRQASAITDASKSKDPENRLLSRGPRFRMPAEMLRDNALAVSGLLVAKIGGPPVKPYQPAGLWAELAGGASQGPYKQGSGEDLYRRSMYTYRKRTVPPPSLTIFDAPGWDICSVARGRTNTPLQALALLNDVTYVEAARNLAQRMMREGGESVNQRLEHGFRLVMGRLPTQNEAQTLQSGYDGFLATYSADAEAAEAFVNHGESEVDASAEPSSLAAYTGVATVILNLDEAITKE